MYTQTIFSFGGVNVTTIVPDIMIPDIRIPLRPEVRRRKLVIPGRDGSWDFGVGEKQDFNIEVDFTIMAADSGVLKVKMRSLSDFLEGKKELIFSDDLSIAYMAQVFATVLLKKRVFSYAQSGTIVFECDAGDTSYITGVYEVHGLVVSQVDSSLIYGALVKLFEGSDADPSQDIPIKQATTDIEGRFSLGRVPNGLYSVSVSKSGFVTSTHNHTVASSSVYAQFILAASV